MRTGCCQPKWCFIMKIYEREQRRPRGGVRYKRQALWMTPDPKSERYHIGLITHRIQALSPF